MKNEIMQRVHDHLEEARERFDDSRIVGVFLQGSQNYGLHLLIVKEEIYQSQLKWLWG